MQMGAHVHTSAAVDFSTLVLTVHIVRARHALSLIGLFVSSQPSMSHVCLESDFGMFSVPIILEENDGDGDDKC